MDCCSSCFCCAAVVKAANGNALGPAIVALVAAHNPVTSVKAIFLAKQQSGASNIWWPAKPQSCKGCKSRSADAYLSSYCQELRCTRTAETGALNPHISLPWHMLCSPACNKLQSCCVPPTVRLTRREQQRQTSRMPRLYWNLACLARGGNGNPSRLCC